MPSITFISTIHKEIGQCNSEELCKIIAKLSPEVVFLEADEQTYPAYDQYLFSTYGVYHRKLEIAAIQKYGHITSFQYVTVCDGGLSDAFHRKIKVVCQYIEVQQLVDKFNSFAAEQGFAFLNSPECIRLQDEMRAVESELINSSDVDKIIEADIHAYEDAMIKNIYLYCKINSFNSAIFMCGAAHRKSIIEKIEKAKIEEKLNLTWTVFEGSTYLNRYQKQS